MLRLRRCTFERERMWVGLSDGRVIGVPLAWFPRLAQALATEREGFAISPFGIHLEALDEDASVEGPLEGRGADPGRGRGGIDVGVGTHPTCYLRSARQAAEPSV